MGSNIADLQAQGEALVQEMNALAQSLSALTAAAEHTQTQLTQFDSEIADMLAHAGSAVTAHVADLQKVGAELQPAIDQFKSAADQGAQELHANSASVASVISHFAGAVDSAKSAATHLEQNISQEASSLTSQVAQFQQTLQQTESEIESRQQQATQAMQSCAQDFNEVQKAWSNLGDEAQHAVTAGLSSVSEQLDSSLLNPLDEALKQFQNAVQQLEESVVVQQLNALAEQLKDAVLNQTKQEIDAAVEALSKEVDDAIQQLVSSGAHNQGMVGELKQGLAALKSIFDEVSQALEQVTNVFNLAKDSLASMG